MFTLMRFAFRIGIHIELSHQTGKNFPRRTSLPRDDDRRRFRPRSSIIRLRHRS